MEKIFKRPNGKYWEPHFIDILEKANSYYDLTNIAFKILDKIPDPIVQICGPISTGGKGSLQQNIEEFDKAIFFFASKGDNIFDQMPFQDTMVRLSMNIQGYDERILNDFYLPLFESGKVRTYKFLPGWESSKGATWEHEQLTRLQHTIIYLPHNWHTMLCA